ncbi:tetratricopeptide repeat protein [Pseudomonas entomophila]|uniref:tetratricopeptide repeat protein n=1 Tax=Pseudomonas entomophila TaxID=312306 RepID=UPI0023D826BF|nr:tetratricopeptide repeat protein [Pseudomonas entomophila]MDF0733063.1 tetratricopeptide repeat protein [Pseudomonas entomophila]
MPNRLPSTLLLLASALLAACSSQPPATDAGYERLMHLAGDLQKRGDNASAAALYENAAQQPGSHPEAWLKLGETALAGGDARAAERAYQQALQARPNDADALLGLGSAQLRLGKLERAVTALTQAAERGDQPAAWNRLGVAQILRGQASAAQAAFAKSLALAPDDLDSRCNLALAYALDGQAQRALDSLRPVGQSPRALPRHQRNMLLVTVLAGHEQDVSGLALDDLSADERQALLAEARRIKALPDAQAQARALGLVDGR